MTDDGTGGGCRSVWRSPPTRRWPDASREQPMRHRLLASAAVSAALVTAAVPTTALAAPLPQHTMQSNCDGRGTVEILTSPAADDSWERGRSPVAAHLVPVEFRHLVYDDTAEVTLFDGTVTHAPARQPAGRHPLHRHPQTVLGAIAPSDFVPPDGVALTDQVWFISTVVPKPRPHALVRSHRTEDTHERHRCINGPGPRPRTSRLHWDRFGRRGHPGRQLARARWAARGGPAPPSLPSAVRRRGRRAVRPGRPSHPPNRSATLILGILAVLSLPLFVRGHSRDRCGRASGPTGGHPTQPSRGGRQHPRRRLRCFSGDLGPVGDGAPVVARAATDTARTWVGSRREPPPGRRPRRRSPTRRPLQHAHN